MGFCAFIFHILSLSFFLLSLHQNGVEKRAELVGWLQNVRNFDLDSCVCVLTIYAYEIWISVVKIDSDMGRGYIELIFHIFTQWPMLMPAKQKSRKKVRQHNLFIETISNDFHKHFVIQ